ncbi:MAG: pantoate--beta-alanine ligase [Paludibacteraceae bacterium]|nr:pantoate--beta-alanine ligase [Paludibacteraceae bacterium]
MKICKKTLGLKRELNKLRKEGKTIGFVPTMGALHNGHLSLVKKCVAENDVCVVSVFVNPTQFNNKSDLEKYPRTLSKDAKLLESANCTILFAPSEDQIYPEPDTRQFDFGQLDKVMEGKYRPGHFNGVAQVVSRLFDIVGPDRAYFGEKDFQQLAIIREMVKQLNSPVKIVGCPIVREEDGMALSSRNMRLSKDEREKAVLISQTLLKSCNFVPQKSVSELKQWVVEQINNEPVLNVEYFDIVDGLTMQSINNWDDTDYAVGCITVYCGEEVRLIDNMKYKEPKF